MFIVILAWMVTGACFVGWAVLTGIADLWHGRFVRVGICLLTLLAGFAVFRVSVETGPPHQPFVTLLPHMLFAIVTGIVVCVLAFQSPHRRKTLRLCVFAMLCVVGVVLGDYAVMTSNADRSVAAQILRAVAEASNDMLAILFLPVAAYGIPLIAFRASRRLAILNGY